MCSRDGETFRRRDLFKGDERNVRHCRHKRKNILFWQAHLLILCHDNYLDIMRITGWVWNDKEKSRSCCTQIIYSISKLKVLQTTMMKICFFQKQLMALICWLFSHWLFTRIQNSALNTSFCIFQKNYFLENV